MVIQFIKSVIAGEYDFNGFVGKLGEFFNFLGATVISGELTLKSFFSSAGLYSYILMGVGALLLLYGKKYLPLIKLLLFGGVGYVVGYVILAPMIAPYLGESSLFSPITCGAVTALILAVLSKLVYSILFYGIAAMFAYVIAYAGGLIELPTIGNATLSYAVVGAVVLLLLIKRKSAERLGTAFLGSYLIVSGISKNFYALVSPTIWIIIGVLSLIGYRFQYRRRKKYY